MKNNRKLYISIIFVLLVLVVSFIFVNSYGDKDDVKEPFSFFHFNKQSGNIGKIFKKRALDHNFEQQKKNNLKKCRDFKGHWPKHCCTYYAMKKKGKKDTSECVKRTKDCLYKYKKEGKTFRNEKCRKLAVKSGGYEPK